MKTLSIAAAVLLATSGAQAQVTPAFDITGAWSPADGRAIQIFQDPDTGDVTALDV